MTPPSVPPQARLENLDNLTLRRCVACDRVFGLHLIQTYDVHEKKGVPTDLRMTLECPPTGGR